MSLWDNYARQTAHLSMIEHGAYRLLLDWYMQTGIKLEANEKQLLRVCRAFATEEKHALLSVLKQFFKLVDGHYVHDDAEAALENRKKISEVRRFAGAIGGAKPKAKRQTNTEAKEKQLLGTSLSSSLSSQKKENARAAARVSTAAPPAAKPGAGPGWESEFPLWAKVRASFFEMHGSDTLWQNTFAPCRPNGCETTIVCASIFDRDRLEQQFSDKLEKIFKARITFKFEPKPKEASK